MKKNFKLLSLVIFLILLTVGIGMVANKVNVFDNMVKNNEKYTSIGGDDYGDSWEFGEWTIATTISSDLGNATITDETSALYSSTLSSIDETKLSYKISGTYTDGTASSNIDATYFGFLVPISLHGSYSNYSQSVDTTANQLSIINGNETVAYVKFSDDLPYCNTPDYVDECNLSDSVKFFWYEVGDQIYILYKDEFKANDDSGNDFSFDISFDYYANPSYLTVGESYSTNTAVLFDYVDVTLNSISVTYDPPVVSSISLDNLTASSPVEYVTPSSSWNVDTDYDVYLDYEISGKIDGSGAYDLNISTVENQGDIVAYSVLGGEYISDDTTNLCSVTNSTVRNFNCHIIVGYNLNGSESIETLFEVKSTATAGSASDEKNFSWNYTYTYKEPEYPTNSSMTPSLLEISDASLNGAINKLENGNTVESSWKMETGVSTFNTTVSGSKVKSFLLWNLTDKGTTDYTTTIETQEPFWDTTYSSIGTTNTLDTNDYQINSFYIVDDVEYSYVLNNNSYALDEDDVDTYSEKKVYGYKDGSWVLLGTYIKNSTGINYTDSSGLSSSVTGVDSNNTILLNDGITKIRVSYTGKKAAIYLGIVYNLEIKATDNVLIELDGKDSDILKNTIMASNSSSNPSDTTSIKGTYLKKYNVTSVSSYTSEVLDSDEDNNDVVSYTYITYDSINCTDCDLLNDRKQAVVYFLLPQGANLDGDVTVLTYGNNTSVDVTTEETKEYVDGRNLVKIIIDDTNITSNHNTSSSMMRTGFIFKYQITYSTRSKQSYGVTLLSDVVYSSNTKFIDSTENIETTKVSSSDVLDTYKDLELNSYKAFDTNSVKVSELSVTIGKYYNEVLDTSDNTYKSSINVVESKEYTYRLQYVPIASTDRIENVIFADNLDGNYGENIHFQGILKSIDTSYLNKKGVTTTIYYATEEVDLSNIDLTSDIWSNTIPSDLTKIKAIAVSCGDYVFNDTDNIAPMINITLQVPNNYQSGIKAYNNSVLQYSVNGTTSKLNSTSTEVTYTEANISIDSNLYKSEDSDNEGKGSEDSPILITGDYYYKLSIQNNDDTNYNNVTIINKLPSNIVYSEIKAIGDISLTKYSIEYDEGTNTLKVNINTLDNNEKIEFWIPIALTEDVLDSDNALLTDTVQMSSLNGYNYNGEIIKIYSRVMIPSLDFDKYVKTASSGEYTKDETLIIKPGETYYYKMHIENTSNVLASDINVEDNVAIGLNVNTSSIDNNGVYDSTNNKITWNINLDANESIDLVYSVTVPSDINLGQIYASKGHIKLINPLNNSKYLYDNDTNTIRTVYQIASDIVINSKVDGNLADKDKYFEYQIEVAGSESNTGEYKVLDKDKNELDSLIIGSDGKGSYNVLLKDGESITVKLLPGNINYTISQKKDSAYTTSITDGVDSSDKISISDITEKDGAISYTFTNTYTASGGVQLKAKVTYDKELLDDMFTIIYQDKEYKVSSSGEVTFDKIEYQDETGLYKYTITQKDTKISQIYYDTTIYTATVLVSDNKDGTLKTEVHYYNQNNEEVEEVIFNNYYVPTGLMIRNVNTSKYINPDIEFKYHISIEEATAGNYKVLKNKDTELDELIIGEDEKGSLDITLNSNEYVTIVDLPIGSKYSVTQDKLDYYVTSLSISSSSEQREDISSSGILGDESLQLIFNNLYETTATYSPIAYVTYDQELTDGLFNFNLIDTSDGSTKGYTDNESNNIDGIINFDEITYDRPGTYTYKITEVKGDSNHIYYDDSECLLTVVLTDNGDGTMDYTYQYVYGNKLEAFNNVYSEEEIVPVVPSSSDKEITNNPNTIDYIIGIFLTADLLLFILIVIKRLHVRKYL